MRCPDPTPEQLAEDRHTFALANGSPCGADCARCYPTQTAPRNRRELRALVTTLLRRGFAVRDAARRVG